MAFSLTKKRFLFWVTLFILLFAIIVGYVLKVLMPLHYFEWYPFIPIFFYLLSLYSIYTFDYCRKHHPTKLLSVYLGMKFVKMILSMIIILIYVLSVKVHKEDFILVFFMFYLLSTVFQSSFFYLYEANKKKQNLEKK